MCSAVEGGGGGGERKKVNRGRRAELIPEDLIIEILLNLPVISLLRFKCVCKLWYNLILSCDFITAHYESNKNRSNGVTLFCYSRKHIAPASPPLATTTAMSFRLNSVPMDLTVPLEAPNRPRIVGCSNGVVCLSLSPTAYQHDAFVLWNPATRQVRGFGGPDHHLRQSRGRKSYSGFCFNPIAKSFKLARLGFVRCENNKHVAQVSITTTEAEDSWKQKTIDIPYQISSGWRCSIGPSRSVKTCMYWYVFLGKRGHDNTPPASQEEEDHYLLCFDMIDEMFKRIETPHGVNLSRSYSLTRMYVYKDSLAMFVQKRTHPHSIYCSSFDVWVMNDHSGGERSWSKKLTFEPPMSSWRALGFYIKDNVDLVVLSTYFNKCLLYDPETQRAIMELPLEDPFPRFFWFTENLASLN